ncbi:MAG: PHP domain-containing protein [Acidimicrobiia bacterium]|jgi:3',5'-nucleoside bisphosphate phosphatase
MAVDLHTHSRASDGSDEPAVLVERAARAGLRALALTDHDTLDGIPEARETANRLGLELVPGVELSLEWDRGGMHMLVLWLEPGPGPLQDRLSRLQEGRERRNRRMVERLRELGIDIDYREVEAEAGPGVVGRPHLAAVLVRKSVVPDIPTAFTEYLAKGRPAYVDRERLGPHEAIGLARSSGAVPVLAHPHTLDLDDPFEMDDILADLRDSGLVGLECHYGTYGAVQRAAMVALARRHGLIPSGGSDYHGTYKADVLLGTGRVGITVPDEVLAELSSARTSG